MTELTAAGGLDSSASDRRRYRTRSLAAFMWAFAGFWLLVGVLQLVIPGGNPATGITAIVLSMPVARLAMTQLVADRTGVTVRGAFRTVRIPWGEVAGFSTGRYMFLGCVLLVHLTGGRRVPVVAVEGITGEPQRKSTVQARAIADELNARLTRATG